MRLSIETFVPRHDKLLCIDSDGTVIDTMNVKHNRCLGKSFIEEWGLAPYAEAVQRVWNDINLREKSRGINRFLALDEMLGRMEGVYLHTDPEELAAYRGWLRKGALSGKDLAAEIAEAPSPLLEKALRWSESSNEKIAALTPADKPPFAHARETLEAAREQADLAVVSTSTCSTIAEEWGAHGLLDNLSVIAGQEAGVKEVCIRKMLEKGYRAENAIMIGDAYPDVRAAEANGVWYYPILTGHEAESWEAFRTRYLPLFFAGRFGEAQQELLNRFANNFFTRQSD